MKLKKEYEMTFKEGFRLGVRLTRAKAYIENGLYNAAAEQGLNPVFVQTWCLESSMFVINNS